MKRLTSLLIVFIVFTSCHDKSPLPVIDIFLSKTGMDTITSGSGLVKGMTIYNKGNSTLAINDFIFSCNCTTVDIKKGTVIQANDSAVVKVRIVPDSTDKGKKQKVNITFKTNAQPSFIAIEIPYYIK